MPRDQPLTSRTAIERMIRIDREIESGNYPNCRKLAKMLEVSQKTIQRDIEFLRDRLTYPIAYDASLHGFYYTESTESLPGLRVTEGEILALFVAGQALPQFEGTPFEQPLRSAFRKLATSLGGAITISLRDLHECLSYRATGIARPDLEIFQTVSKAVQESRELIFSYHKLEDVRPRNRRAQPLHLAGINHQWYLFAFDCDRRALRTFALTRFQNTPKLGKPFQKPKSFSLPRLLANSFGVFTGQGNHRVRIHFDSFAARLIAERQWHPSQKITPHPDGSLELEMHLGALQEVESWILSWGGHATVISPSALKKRIREAVYSLNKLYDGSPSWLADLHQLTPDPNQLEFPLAAQ